MIDSVYVSLVPAAKLAAVPPIGCLDCVINPFGCLDCVINSIYHTDDGQQVLAEKACQHDHQLKHIEHFVVQMVRFFYWVVVMLA